MDTIIGAIVAIATAGLAAYFVVWQIGRQARHAIDQNKHNESLRLKLDLYRELSNILRIASQSEVALASFIRSFDTSVELFKSLTQAGIPGTIPRARSAEYIDLQYDFSDKVIDIIHFIEKWQIIDPRVDIFKTAVNAVKYVADRKLNGYFRFSVRLMPTILPQGVQQGQLFPWRPPNDNEAEMLSELSSECIEALMDVSMVIVDFQVEMQRLMLGELFLNKIEPRKPIAARWPVIELDKYDELNVFFANETEWGREKQRLERMIKGEE